MNKLVQLPVKTADTTLHYGHMDPIMTVQTLYMSYAISLTQKNKLSKLLVADCNLLQMLILFVLRPDGNFTAPVAVTKTTEGQPRRLPFAGRACRDIVAIGRSSSADKTGIKFLTVK